MSEASTRDCEFWGLVSYFSLCVCSLGPGVGVRVQRCAVSEYSFSLWGFLGCGFVALVGYRDTCLV